MSAQHPLFNALYQFGSGRLFAGHTTGHTYITNGQVLAAWDGHRDDVIDDGKPIAVEKVMKPEPVAALSVSLAALLAWCGGPREEEECDECDGTAIQDAFSNDGKYRCSDCGSEKIERCCPECDDGMIREEHRAGDIRVGEETCVVDRLLLRAALSSFSEGTARIVPYPLGSANGIVLYGDGWQLYVVANTGAPTGEAFEVGEVQR